MSPPKLTPRQRKLRARAAGATARGNTALAEEARQQFRALSLEEHIRREVATWPPLTPEARSELAILLLAPAGGGHAAP